MQSANFESIPLQTIPNPQGRGVGTLDESQPSLGPAEANTEPGADSRVQQPVRGIPLPFPNRIVSARRFKIDEDLLKLFRKVEINIPFLDAIKQVPKYAKFLNELYVQRILPKKCQDLGIFIVPCIISNCTFTDTMLDLGASINVMCST
ncbi:hypothetical protein CR513_37312, partial [Mucuna pruriens]